jgi:hypothetical protein
MGSQFFHERIRDCWRKGCMARCTTCRERGAPAVLWSRVVVAAMIGLCLGKSGVD